MPVFVSKFGGTSLASGDGFKRVFDIVLKNPDRRLIVLSAPGKRFRADTKITDQLLRCEESGCPADFAPVRARFLNIAKDAGVSIEEELDESEETIFSGKGKACAASRGEYLSAKIFSKMSGFAFLDAKDAVFFHNGKIDENQSKTAIKNTFQAQKRIVMPGFYGADEYGRICLFPRGGSDTTGALAAFCIDADAYENWTDVDGVFHSDPQLDPKQTPINRLTYDEAQRILDAGAAVLHPDCLYWARKKGTPIIVRNTFRPHLPGTCIGP